MIFKRTIIFIFIFISALPLYCADFKFGVMSAVKASAEHLDKKYKELGGGVPLAPSNTAADTMSYMQVNVSWADNSTNERGFRIKRSASGAAGPFSVAGTVSVNTTYYIDTGLTPNSTYYYRVFSYNGIAETGGLDVPMAVTSSIIFKNLGSYANPNTYKSRVQGSYAYISCKSDGIKVLDISNSSAPVVTGAFNIPGGTCNNLDIYGNYVYAAYGTSGIKIIDISNPALPTLTGTYVSSNTVNGAAVSYTSVKVAGNYAYAASVLGIEIIDISNPSAPALLGYTSDYTGNGPDAIYISGAYAYMADGTNGIKIISISNPAAPSITGLLRDLSSTSSNSSMTYASDIYVKGSYAYTADRYNGLKIIDISNPRSPSVISAVIVQSPNTTSVFVKDNYVFLTASDGTLYLVGVFDNKTPAPFATFQAAYGINNINVSGTRLYLSTAGGLYVVDSNLIYSNSTLAPNAPSNLSITPVSATRLTLSWTDNSDNEDGFKIERRSASSAYAQIATAPENVTIYNDDSVLESTSYYYRLRAYNSNGNSAYCPEYGPVVSVSTISLAGAFNNSGTAYGVFISTRYAYVAGIDKGMDIIDITNPRSLQLAGSFTVTGGTVTDVYVYGSYAYLCSINNTGATAFTVVNVSDPANPLNIAAVSPDASNSAYCSIITKKYAYVACPGGLYILDISSPSNPVTTGSVGLSNTAVKPGLFINGQFAYYADTTNGFKIIDISNPLSPTVVSAIAAAQIGGELNGVYVSGKYAYIANGSYGLTIYDISNPFLPVYKGNYNTPGYAYNVFVKGRYATVSDGDSGVEVLDILNPSAPAFLGAYITSGRAYESFSKGGYTYVADGNSGLQILSFDMLASVSSEPEMPVNLFSPAQSEYSASLVWSDYLSDYSGFYVRRTTSPYAYGVVVATLSASAASYTDTGLRPNTTYFYNLSAYNTYGVSNLAGLRTRTPLLPIIWVSSASFSNTISDVAISSSTNYIYASLKNTGGVAAIDISNPAAPVSANIPLSYNAENIALKGNYAYLAYGDIGIAKMSIAISSSPVLVSTATGFGYIYNVNISNNYAYCASSTTVDVFDLTPSTPIVLSNHPAFSGGTVVDAKSSGTNIYAADMLGGLQIIDQTSVNTLSLSGAYFQSTTQNTCCVEASGTTVYIGGNAANEGLKVIDASDPAHTKLLASYSSPAIIYNLFKRGNYLFACCGNGEGIRIYDISDPKGPWLIGAYTAPDKCLGLTSSGNYIYASNSNSGSNNLIILQSNLP